MGYEGRNPAFRSALQIERGIREVTQHSAGRRILTGAASIIERVTDDITPDVNGVENVVHVGQHMGVGHQRRVNRDLYWGAAFRLASAAQGIVFFLHDAQQFDRVAELSGKANVESSSGTDALDIDLFRVYPKTVSQGSQDADFVRGVMAIDIERRFRFRITKALGISQNIREIGPFKFHSSQDVIARAIEDAIKAGDPVPHRSFAHNLDDRNAAGTAP